MTIDFDSFSYGTCITIGTEIMMDKQQFDKQTRNICPLGWILWNGIDLIIG